MYSLKCHIQDLTPKAESQFFDLPDEDTPDDRED